MDPSHTRVVGWFMALLRKESTLLRAIVIGRALVLFVITSCQNAPRQVASAPQPATAPTKLPAPAPAPKAEEEASPTPPVPEPPSEEARVRAKANTRGAIACGSAQCVPGREVCIAASDWQCVGSDATHDAETIHACDDGTDCPNGQTCCVSFASAVYSQVCSARRGPGHDCRLEVCAEGGARCPRGQVCTDSVCRAPDRAATCGAAGRCPTTRPLCLWSETNTLCTSYEAFDAEQTGGQQALLTCTRPSDCGPGTQCCTNALWNATQCLTNCDSANNLELCTTAADCTTFAGASRKGGQCLAHADATSLPPWLKFCSFD